MRNPKTKIVNIQVLVELGEGYKPFYSIAVHSSKSVGFFAKRSFRKNVTGHASCASLIYALTQDEVLESIHTSKTKETR